MASKANINRVVASLDVSDNSQWETDNSPKLEIVRKLTGDLELSAEDVASASNNFNRRVEVASVEPIAPATKETISPETRAGEENVGAPATQESETKIKFEAARTRLAGIEEKLEQAHQHRSQVSLEIDKLVQAKDVEVKLIEKLAPSVTFAEGVKAIQAQTTNRLMAQKDAVTKAAGALTVLGVKSFPSKLDESLANRRKTPEQASAHAEFVNQRAAEQREMRG